MKSIYSLILLLSFITGVLQPVMPMVEYVVSEADVLNVFDAGDKTESCSATDSCLSLEKMAGICDCCEDESNDQESLLDTDFYPIPIQTVQTTSHPALTVISGNNAFTDEQILSHYYSTLSPPPKQV
jgi:hypothetical protein